MNYYLLNNKKEKKGPYAEEVLRRYWAEGKIPSGTLCCTKEMGSWKPIEQFDNIVQSEKPTEPVNELTEEPQPNIWMKFALASIVLLVIGSIGFLALQVSIKKIDTENPTGSTSKPLQSIGKDTKQAETNKVESTVITPVDNNCSRLAVTPASYDDMGKLLKQLGEGYKFDNISNQDLLYPEKISKYDVLFITCGPSAIRTPSALNFPFTSGDGGQKDIQGYLGKNTTILLRAFGTPYSSQTITNNALWVYKGLNITDTNGKKSSSVRFTISGNVVQKVELVTTQEIINGNHTHLPINESLRSYVENGGIIYASDLRFPLLQVAFKEHIDTTRLYTGTRQQTEAEVIDQSLQDFLGAKTVPINFNAGGWRLAAFKGDTVKVLLKGSVSLSSGKTISTPLMVKFPVGKGYVIFTSFHNAEQKSELELKLLKYLVFNSITSGVNVEIAEQLAPKDMKPRMNQLISFGLPGQPSSQSFFCRKNGEAVFALAFQCNGAKFKLIATGPNGKKLEKEGSHSFFISESQVKEGDQWKLEVIPLSVPHNNFAVRLSVWQ